MRASRLLPLLLLGLALGACQPMGNVRTERTPGASGTVGGDVIRGRVSYLERIAVPQGSTLDVQLVDNRLADTPDAVVAEQRFADISGPPFDFALPYDPSRLNGGGDYGLHASLFAPDGTLMFVTDARVPVQPGSGQVVAFRMIRATNGAGTGAGSTAAPPGSAAQDAAAWADAKARGVGFRAVGNEPAWSAEVMMGDTPQMHIVTGNGRQPLDVPQSQPFSDAAAGTAGFRGNVDGTFVELDIKRGSCRDELSGESFDASAQLRVGDQHYEGCGRFLF